MNELPPLPERVTIGLVSVSDRASSGVYADQGLPALRDWLARALRNPVVWHERLIPDEEARIGACLRELVDAMRCDLVLTTGGTGPAPRDVTPEATLAVAHKVMPGFGEQMRQISLAFVPTAILSRQVAVIRGQALIINLPPCRTASTSSAARTWKPLRPCARPSGPSRPSGCDRHRPDTAARRAPAPAT